MSRLAYLLAILPAACTMAADNRPHTVEYVTEAVLAPYCGAAQCHSTFAANYSDIFDTVVGTRSTIVRNGLVRLDGLVDDRKAPAASYLVTVVEQPFGKTPAIGRMPWDAPLPQDDIELLKAWIKDGAHGAQCDPEAPEGLACDGDTVRECGPDWEFFTPIEDCAKNKQHCLLPTELSGVALPARCG